MFSISIRRILIFACSFLAIFSFLFSLSYRFPFIYGDGILYMSEATKEFQFPQGHVMVPRFVFVYIYKLIFFFVGFQPLVFHAAKALAGAGSVVLLYFITKQLTNQRYALFSAGALLTNSLFIFTTIWLSEPITYSMFFLLASVYVLLFLDQRWKYLLLFFLVPAAVFTKEPSLLLLPLFVYYFFAREKGRRRLYALIPLICFLGYFFIPTSEYIGNNK